MSVHISRKPRKRDLWMEGKRQLRHASASEAHTAPLIYQFGSNVNNRAIARTQYRDTNSTGAEGLSFQETRSTDHVRRARKFSRDRPLSVRSTRPGQYLHVPRDRPGVSPSAALSTSSGSWDTRLSISTFLFSLSPLTGSNQSFLFFFHRALTYVSSDSFHFLIKIYLPLPFPFSLSFSIHSLFRRDKMF